ncbi:DUF2766 family protein, partial [Serratia marcescens]|nr:DUF2766 family protein [Serratia marcescens]
KRIDFPPHPAGADPVTGGAFHTAIALTDMTLPPKCGGAAETRRRRAVAVNPPPFRFS